MCASMQVCHFTCTVIEIISQNYYYGTARGFTGFLYIDVMCQLVVVNTIVFIIKSASY